MSAPLSSSRFLLHCSNSSGEIEGVANYLKIKWFGRHVGNGNAARRGRSWILLALLVLLSHRACLCTGCAKESRCSEYSATLNEHSFLSTCLLWVKGPKWSAGQRHQLTSCKGREAVFNYIWSWWEISYSFRISNPPRNTLCMLDYSTHEFFQKWKRNCGINLVFTSKGVSPRIYMQLLKIRWVLLNLP